MGRKTQQVGERGRGDKFAETSATLGRIDDIVFHV